MNSHMKQATLYCQTWDLKLIVIPSLAIYKTFESLVVYLSQTLSIPPNFLSLVQTNKNIQDLS